MIPKKHRQLMLLVGLLLIFVVVLAFELRTSEPPPPTAAATAPSNRVGRGATTPARARDAAVIDVRLDALQRPGDGALGTSRNPFRFRPKPAPPPPPRAIERPVAVAPPVPTGPPPPPPIPLRFIGVLDGQPRVGVLSDGRGNVFYGKDGDIIDGRYRVLRIGPDSADLSYTDGRGRQTLRLSGQ